MRKMINQVNPVLWCIFCLFIVMVVAGCADEQQVRDYVGQELESVKTERIKPLEDDLAETRAELQSLRKEVEEKPEPLEQVLNGLNENREELQWLREDIDDMDARLTSLESAVQGLAETGEVLGVPREAVPEQMLEPAPRTAPEGVPTAGVEAQVSKPVEENLTVLANELKKLRARINDVSRHIEHVDEQYQQYHEEVGRLRVDIMNEVDALDNKVLALDDKITALKDAQKMIRAEMAEQSQKDVKTLEEKLRGLILGLPK